RRREGSGKARAEPLKPVSGIAQTTKKPAGKAGFFFIFSLGSADDFGAREPVCDFFRSGFRSVRTVYGVFADRQGEFLADGAFISVCRVGRTHDFAVLGDGVFAFQNL